MSTALLSSLSTYTTFSAIFLTISAQIWTIPAVCFKHYFFSLRITQLKNSCCWGCWFNPLVCIKACSRHLFAAFSFFFLYMFPLFSWSFNFITYSMFILFSFLPSYFMVSRMSLILKLLSFWLQLLSIGMSFYTILVFLPCWIPSMEGNTWSLFNFSVITVVLVSSYCLSESTSSKS